MQENIENKLLSNEQLTEEEIYNFLSYIVYKVRNIINDEKMINKCDAVQGIICRYLDKLHVKYNACNTQSQISKNVTGHSFTVINFSGLLFLVDPSFVQFAYDTEDDLYINNMKVKSVSPYVYAKDDLDKLQIMIDNGFIRLDANAAAWYGNSFYKTQIGIPKDYPLMNMNGSIYINSFLKGTDSLKNYDYPDIELSNRKGKLQK